MPRMTVLDVTHQEASRRAVVALEAVGRALRLALATRAGVPIFAAEGALRYACPLPEDPRTLREWLEEADARTLHEWLEGVTPEDFRALGPAEE